MQKAIGDIPPLGTWSSSKLGTSPQENPGFGVKDSVFRLDVSLLEVVDVVLIICERVGLVQRVPYPFLAECTGSLTVFMGIGK